MGNPYWEQRSDSCVWTAYCCCEDTNQSYRMGWNVLWPECFMSWHSAFLKSSWEATVVLTGWDATGDDKEHYLSLWLCESMLSMRNWKALLVYGICYSLHQQPKKDITCQLAHHSDFPSLLFSFGSLPATRLITTLSWGRWFADVWQRGGRSGSFMHVAHIYEIPVIWPEVINL